MPRYVKIREAMGYAVLEEVGGRSASSNCFDF